MAGILDNLLFASMGRLLTDISMFAAVDDMPFSIIKIAMLLGWLAGCLYLVMLAEKSTLVPAEFRSTIQVCAIFFGPLIFLMLVILEKAGIIKRSLAPISSSDPREPIPHKPSVKAAKKSPPELPGKAKQLFTNLVPFAKDVLSKIWSSRSQQVDDVETLQLFDSSGTEISEIYGHASGGTANRHVLNLTSQIIDNALQMRASDILIDPIDQALYAVRLRIDGALRTVRQMPSETSRSVINSVKAVSNMDISERRRPQDGAFTARKGLISTSFRVATAGAMNGEKLSIRVLNQNASGFTLADVGIPDEQRTAILNAVNKPSGMVLVCGPTGSGKTTTLYSLLNQIDRLTHNVITVEDPIEAHLKDASQIEINAKADITFAKALRSILRQDPDVISVGEIRDEETASIALRAAQTGHLVLATIHCDSNANALIRLLDLGVSPLLLSSGLSLLISQRLIRRLCDHCKRPADLSPAVREQFEKNGIDTQYISMPGSCDVCGGTGYYGRMAICDVLHISEDMRAEIANSGTIMNKLRGEGEKKGKATLKSEALRYVIAGLTSLDELKRVVG
jgi:general secretion pathway protein E